MPCALSRGRSLNAKETRGDRHCAKGPPPDGTGTVAAGGWPVTDRGGWPTRKTGPEVPAVVIARQPQSRVRSLRVRPSRRTSVNAPFTNAPHPQYRGRDAVASNATCSPHRKPHNLGPGRQQTCFYPKEWATRCCCSAPYDRFFFLLQKSSLPSFYASPAYAPRVRHPPKPPAPPQKKH